MSKYVVSATWDESPHLDPATKATILASIPPYQRDARTKGIPQLGAGAIFPVPESQIVVEPFTIPEKWPRAYGLDVGWNVTAAVWCAIDPDIGTTYFIHEYYRQEAEPSIHAAAIMGRGKWIPGVIDPAARGRSQIDGGQLLQNYQDLGLDLTSAQNKVESGLGSMWEAMESGRLKVFSTLMHWLAEFRLYRRDEKGRVVKKFDHCQDASRYLWVSGRDIAKVKPVKSVPMNTFMDSRDFGSGWLG